MKVVVLVLPVISDDEVEFRDFANEDELQVALTDNSIPAGSLVVVGNFTMRRVLKDTIVRTVSRLADCQ